MKFRSKMTRSLFVVVIAMCLNISVVLPSFALTQKECISRIYWSKIAEAVGTGIGATSLAISGPIGICIGVAGGLMLVCGKEFRAHYEYCKDESVCHYKKKSAAESQEDTKSDEKRRSTNSIYWDKTYDTVGVGIGVIGKGIDKYGKYLENENYKNIGTAGCIIGGLVSAFGKILRAHHEYYKDEACLCNSQKTPQIFKKIPWTI